MGTITRAFANNITTSGVFTSSAFNNDSFDNVTAVPSGSVTTGDMVLVSSATASSSASIEFTLGDYKEYKFFLVNIHPANDNIGFEFNFSTDNGSNYNVTKTSTFHRAYHNEAGAGAVLEYQGAHDLAQSTAYQDIITQAGNDADQASSGYIHIFNPSNSVFVKHYIGQMSTITYHDYNINNFFAGYANTTSALTNIKFQMDSGNIDDGKILMFGVN